MQNSFSQKGFTLIELLVVVSIVALLSSIILPSVNSIRDKAENSRVNQEVGQWMNAIELYRGDNDGNYPIENTPNWPACLGEGPAFPFCLSTSVNNNFRNDMFGYIGLDKNPNRGGIESPFPFISFYSFYLYKSPYNRGEVTWYLKGDVNCSRVHDDRYYSSWGDVTQCVGYVE
jgi:prepilin-type N-terminal cleavage/methylation domain-containing protein